MYSASQYGLESRGRGGGGDDGGGGREQDSGLRLATCGEMDALVGKCEEILRCERSDPDILEMHSSKKKQGGACRKKSEAFLVRERS